MRGHVITLPDPERKRMALYRTLEAVSYVKDGAVVSVAANRDVELTEAQAAKLEGKLVQAADSKSMFPNAVIIPAGMPQPAKSAEVDPKSLVSSLPQPKAGPAPKLVDDKK